MERGFLCQLKQSKALAQSNRTYDTLDKLFYSPLFAFLSPWLLHSCICDGNDGIMMMIRDANTEIMLNQTDYGSQEFPSSSSSSEESESQQRLLSSTELDDLQLLTARMELLHLKIQNLQKKVSSLESCQCIRNCQVNGTTVNDGETWKHECDVCSCEVCVSPPFNWFLFFLIWLFPRSLSSSSSPSLQVFQFFVTSTHFLSHPPRLVSEMTLTRDSFFVLISSLPFFPPSSRRQLFLSSNIGSFIPSHTLH